MIVALWKSNGDDCDGFEKIFLFGYQVFGEEIAGEEIEEAMVVVEVSQAPVKVFEDGEEVDMGAKSNMLSKLVSFEKPGYSAN